MNTDTRCCGSGTCIIDAEGRCWCGQRWDGERMCHTPVAPPAPAPSVSESPAQPPPTAQQP
jgi:hypothetical protein